MAQRSGGFQAIAVKRAAGVENSPHSLHDSGWSRGDKARAPSRQEPRIALFLTGDDFRDHHWRVRGHGFLDGRTTGFADE